jgi:hypothetical protein
VAELSAAAMPQEDLMPESLGAEGVADWYRRKQEQHRERAAKRPPDWQRMARLVHESARYIVMDKSVGPVRTVTGGTYVDSHKPARKLARRQRLERNKKHAQLQRRRRRA